MHCHDTTQHERGASEGRARGERGATRHAHVLSRTLAPYTHSLIRTHTHSHSHSHSHPHSHAQAGRTLYDRFEAAGTPVQTGDAMIVVFGASMHTHTHTHAPSHARTQTQTHIHRRSRLICVKQARQLPLASRARQLAGNENQAIAGVTTFGAFIRESSSEPTGGGTRMGA